VVIEKGKDWGNPGVLPASAPTAATNQELRSLLQSGERTVGVTGGDLCRTLGGSGSLSMTFPVDLCRLRADGFDEVFVAHCVARRSWWFGPILAIMNAQFIGSWDVAPRGHPNDGYADVLEVTMGVADRFKARKRLSTGTHVPHPDIAQRRITAATFTFAKPSPIWLDGDRIGPLAEFSILVEPDALTVVL
jgi:YegS C-terminal NAD kinase beta sandwich-like domain